MRTGRCQCGEIRYESVGEPIGLYICHCRECQKQSASAFGISLRIPRVGFRVTQGTPKYWTRDTDSGRKLKCAFCANCGSRLWHEHVPALDYVSLKGDHLTNPSTLPMQSMCGSSAKYQALLFPKVLNNLLRHNLTSYFKS